MDEAEARKVLDEHIEEWCDGLGEGYDPTINWEPDEDKVFLEGDFSVHDLEAIIWWIKNKGD